MVAASITRSRLGWFHLVHLLKRHSRGASLVLLASQSFADTTTRPSLLHPKCAIAAPITVTASPEFFRNH
jgi:hypothetical protein